MAAFAEDKEKTMTTEDTPSVAETTAAGDQNDTGTPDVDITGQQQTAIADDDGNDVDESSDAVAVPDETKVSPFAQYFRPVQPVAGQPVSPFKGLASHTPEQAAAAVTQTGKATTPSPASRNPLLHYSERPAVLPSVTPVGAPSPVVQLMPKVIALDPRSAVPTELQ
jgi:hypothetical protein